MSDDYVDEMKSQAKSKVSLKTEIISKQSKYEKIFIFEGETDFPAYDEWMKRNETYQKSGHVVARGKSQVLNLYNSSIDIEDYDFLESCLFFVDHDYDLIGNNNKYITTLSCYSVENYVSCKNSVQNYITGEFGLDITKDHIRDEVMEVFSRDFNNFKRLLKELCRPLFVNYNSLDKTKFYERISDLINIEYSNIYKKETNLEIDYEVDEQCEKSIELISTFNSLSYERAIRGKYVFEFIKKWLKSTKDFLLSNHGLRIKNDPLMIDMRRLASSSPIPQEIIAFS